MVDVVIRIVSWAATAVAALMFLACVFSPISSFTGAMAYGAIVFLVYLIFERNGSDHQNWFYRNEHFVLTCFGFLFYMFVLAAAPLFGQHGQAFDTGVAYRAFVSEQICYTHNVICTYWVYYEILLSVIGNVFGHSFVNGQFLNALCCSLVVFPVFKLSEQVAGHGVARFVSLLMILNPALAFYCTAYTGEFLFAVLMLYGMYVYVRMFSGISTFKRNFMSAILSGGFLGLAWIFKPLTYLGMIAGFVVAILFLCQRFSRAAMLKVVLLLCVWVISYGSVKAIAALSFDALGGIDRQTVRGESFGDTMIYELILSLNLDRHGAYNRDLALKVRRSKDRLEILKNAVVRDHQKYPNLMVRKFRNLYGSHNSTGAIMSWYRWTTRDDGAKGNDFPNCPLWAVPLVDNALFLFAMVFFAATIGQFFCRGKEPSEWVPRMTFALIVLGFVGMSMLIEAHGRYRVAVYPFFFLILANVKGLAVPFSYIGKKLLKYYNKFKTARVT